MMWAEGGMLSGGMPRGEPDSWMCTRGGRADSRSGGMYVYYWPRNATDVPDDVRDPSTSTTNVAGWGEPGANLSVPSCRGDFGKHVVVFNIDFCGD